jgi:hypothetical protein
LTFVPPRLVQVNPFEKTFGHSATVVAACDGIIGAWKRSRRKDGWTTSKMRPENSTAKGCSGFRAWICAEFDGCGFSRRSERAEFAALYSIRDFEHEDMREYLAFAPRTTRFTAWTAPGIYAIASDRDWLYVGRATRLSLRRTNHGSTLRSGTHPNRLLQRHWDADSSPMWFVVLEQLGNDAEFRRGAEHPRELTWKRRLRPLYDRELRRADISFLVHPALVSR